MSMISGAGSGRQWKDSYGSLSSAVKNNQWLSAILLGLSSVDDPLPRGWRNESESGGGMNRNRVADCFGIRSQLFRERLHVLTVLYYSRS